MSKHPPMLLFLTAVSAERSALAARLGGEAGPDWRLAQTGIGPHAAAEAAARALAAGPVRAVVFVGLAGGLAADVAVGEVLIAGATHRAGHPDPRPADGVLLERVRSAAAEIRAPHRVCRLLTVGRLVSCPREKARLAAETGCAGVDMESAAAAEAAAAAGVPFVAVRAVSDGPADPLPAELAVLVDDTGSPRPGRLTAALLRRPALAADLWRLKIRCDLALARLAAIAVRLTQPGR